jgi:hypothetical protein
VMDQRDPLKDELHDVRSTLRQNLELNVIDFNVVSEHWRVDIVDDKVFACQGGVSMCSSKIGPNRTLWVSADR